MKKNCTFGKKAFVILMQQFCVLISIGLILHMVLSCIITNESSVYVINPLEDKEYRESNNLREMFMSDSMDLIYYLAVSQQFETEGKFDNNKKIDLTQYYYRRTPNAKKVNSNDALVYRVGDLLKWQLNYDVVGGLIEEQFYPVHGESVYHDLNLVDILDSTLPDGIDGFPEEDLNIILSETAEMTEDSYTEEFGEEVYQDTGDIETDVLQEEALKKKLTQEYDRKEAKARAIFYQLLNSAISDLNINYNKYLAKKEYYNTAQTNFKYIYIPEVQENDNKNFYSNLPITNLLDAKKEKDNFTRENYENNKFYSYFIIDPMSSRVVEKSSNITESSESRMDDALWDMSYAFSNGGYIYIGACASASDNYYVKSDGYARAERAYAYVASNFQQYCIAAIISALSAVILYVLYIMMCGNRAKYELVEEDGIKRKQLILTETKENLNLIDKWYTEVIVLLAGGICTAMVVLYALCFIGLVENDLISIMKSPVYMAATLGYVFMFNGILLFFSSSIVKRIKAGIFLKNSFTFKLCMVLWKGISLILKAIMNGCKAIKDFAVMMYRRLNQLGRLVITYGPFVLLNLMIGATRSGVLILFLIIGDAVIFYYLFRSDVERTEILEGICKINQGQFDFKLDETKMHGDNRKLAVAVNNVGEGIKQAVETSMKDERLKADLITNVSHDIKTPLTSIINYVDLLKRENVQDEKLQEYIQVLEIKAQRLKQLTDDLVEASKISSGNITLVMEKLNVIELMNQVVGEFSEKFKRNHLDIITRFPEEDSIITADGRRMWRVIENLFENINKYAMVGTRVYVEIYEALEHNRKKVFITIKNISAQPLNIRADELTERFIRGDISRNTEGSGLGLSIAQSLVIAQKGQFDIYLDGDLFKVIISFYAEEEDMLI